MTVFQHPGRHRVAVLVRHGLLPVELGIPHRVFGTAKSAGEPLYEVATCAVEAGEVRTDTDVTVNVPHGPEALAEADTVVVPSAHESDESWTDGRLPGALAEALALVRPGARIASICTGSFVLAAAGLLDGRRATTHWDAAERFRRLYPRVRLEPEVLYTEDGGVLTSAGVASGFDLCLHMTRLDFGVAVANRVARRAVVPPYRDGGQAQYIERPIPEPGATSTGKARAWALDRLHEPLTLRQLAECEAMSVRTFTRRFREEVGTSPQRWLLHQRLERARHLLERSGESVDRVAAEAGFGSAASLRLHFQAALGVSPSAYRRTFAGIAVAEHG
ncbi:GlxA family transcriptional regulator [Glycomyces harbinensis]|uniref:Transcriptional regulator GlxA family, contains an amidase domain and an AraC-type DNA-binding HTH domain n=1 Tax=Glycomyces harbinensis TaxID=58114 RepID=A0A1G6QW65_9ACTN|nr:helix-turn-helix domain-containing protein [Glycomyces harbinensis]SDC96204.1 Transcriptional regulator GlxA family, contains an amidase domain and an AraC-type DNA-binding HTH domain [Glycomyces harbinensis]